MKIATVQLNYIIGHVTGNLGKALRAIKEADNGVDLIVLTEMMTTGYPPKDLLHREDMIEANEAARDTIVKFTESTKAAVAFGYVRANSNMGGNPFYNEACIARDGKVIAVRVKTLLPTYDVFAEDRYFEPGKCGKQGSGSEFLPVEIAGEKVGLVICEEIWNRDLQLYPIDPVAETVKGGAKYIVCVNASPYRRGVLEERHKLVRAHCISHGIGMVYVNQIGYNDNVGFDGNSFAINPKGEIIYHAPAWQENCGYFDTKQHSLPDSAWEHDWQSDVLMALTQGINDYFWKNGIAGPAIVCNSGGIDSALVLYLAARARGPKNVLSISLPSEFSSDHSISDAVKLASGLGVRHISISIKDLHDLVRRSVDDGLLQAYDAKVLWDRPWSKADESGVADENLQARIRGLIGMFYANYFNGLMLSTGNKSEMAVGYCTLYGDMCGGLAVISDVLKTDVYSICRWLNETFREEIIPNHTIEKLPSAELRPDQHDQQSLPPYELLDNVLRLLVEQHQSPRQIKKALMTEQKAIDYLAQTNRSLEGDINKSILLTIGAEYKRQQAPTGLKISNKLFKQGWDMPIAHKVRL